MGYQRVSSRRTLVLALVCSVLGCLPPSLQRRPRFGETALDQSMDGFHSNFSRTTIMVRIQFARSQKFVQTGAASLEQKLGATGTYDEPLAANALTHVRFHAASHLTLDRCERCNANDCGRQDF
jgi:hypothetical protein